MWRPAVPIEQSVGSRVVLAVAALVPRHNRAQTERKKHENEQFDDERQRHRVQTRVARVLQCRAVPCSAVQCTPHP